MWKYNYSNELYHWGVKGMKWGVRRNRQHVGPGRYLTSKRQTSGNSKRKTRKLKNSINRDLQVAKNNYVNSKTSTTRDIAVGKEWIKNLNSIDVKTASKKDIRNAKNKAINLINNMDDKEFRSYMSNNK